MEKTYELDETAMAAFMGFEKETILRIIIGFGGRKCLERSLSNSQPTLKVLVLEPDKGLVESYCRENDIKDLLEDKRLELVLGDDEGQLEAVLKSNIKDFNAHYFKIVPLGQYADDKNHFVDKVVEIVKRIIQEVANAEFARKRFNKLPCKNFLYTVKSLNQNYIVYQLLDAIPTRDIPIIIVAAGPSLMNNHMELKRAKGKAIIIAVAHAMKTLYAGGIEPDLVAITDPQDAGYIDFDKEKKNTLLCSVYANENFRRGYDGKIIYYGFNLYREEFAVERTMKEMDVDLNTGSVATDVFSIFVSAGFSKIILVGQDLAYDEKGYSHTGKEDDKADNLESMETEGIYGDTVRTRVDWDHFKRYFEKRIRDDGSVKVIDATEGGALIRGTEIMSLSEAIDTCCDTEYPVDRWIGGLEKGNDDEKEYIEQWFDLSIININRIERLLGEAIVLNDSIRKLWNDVSLWDDAYRASCRKYDVLYDQIMNGVSAELIRMYCTETLQNYIENALVVEGDENTEKRMLLEHELFVKMKEKSSELKEYVKTQALCERL